MIAAGVLSMSAASAAPKAGVPVLDKPTPASTLTLPSRGKAQSAVTGTLSAKALSASGLTFTLPDGQEVTATLERVARDDRQATQSWIGTFEDSPGSIVVLSKAKGVVTGFGTYKEQSFELMPTAGGKHVLFTVDQERLPKADLFKHNVQEAADLMTTTADYGVGAAATLDSTNAVVHDVLILYTSTSASKWGQAALTSMIQSGVQAANQAYVNSLVGITLNVVGIQQAPFSEASGMSATVDRLKSNSTVRSLRDSLAADMVLLVNENSDYCGYATLWYSYSGSYTNWDAYAGVSSGCLSQQVIAHEVGHMQQLDHNRENATGLAAYAYSYGYRLCTADGFRDIMSYPCSSGGSTRISYFSNPSLTFNGYPIGVSYESSPTKAAESARSLNNTAALVASYRVGSATIAPTIPAAPSGMTVQSAAFDRVALAWTDNSSNETGFKVERSTDGVTYTERASLGAGARSFTDTTVSESSRYYYRVRAYNSAGVSGYSNAVSVTTPAAPTTTLPANPSSLAVASATYNSVGLTWVDNATDESGYKVERSPDGVTFTERASLGAGARSFTDGTVSASTRYYYRVRAYNSAGYSGYSNAVSVTTGTASTSPTLPAAPSSVAASNRADGTALVTWSSSSTSVSSFEIRRETWDGRKQVWGRSTVAGTVPSTVLSIIDSTNNGTFRYFVRALNSSGKSGEAGPAAVTVSGGANGGSNRRAK